MKLGHLIEYNKIVSIYIGSPTCHTMRTDSIRLQIVDPGICSILIF